MAKINAHFYSGPARATVRADAPVDDLPLTTHDQMNLVDVLADLFHTEVTAAVVLDRVGLARRYWQFGRTTARDSWLGMVTLMRGGLVEAPLRGLIEAAVHERPYNPTLLRLGQRYGLWAPTGRTNDMDLPPSLPDKLYLLAYNLEKDRMYRVPRLGGALRAAALTELYRDGRLVDDNGRARPADLTPPVADGGLASTVYQQVAAVPARPWSRWVSTGGEAALALIRDRLQKSGWIEIGSRRTLGLVPALAVSLADRETVRELNRECGRVLRGEIPQADADADVVALVALAAAGGVIALVSARERRTWPEHLAAFTAQTGPAATALATT